MQYYADTGSSPVKVQTQLPGVFDMAKLGAQFVVFGTL